MWGGATGLNLTPSDYEHAEAIVKAVERGWPAYLVNEWVKGRAYDSAVWEGAWKPGVYASLSLVLVGAVVIDGVLFAVALAAGGGAYLVPLGTSIGGAAGAGAIGLGSRLAGSPPLTNPGFQGVPGRQTNCVYCAVATDATFAGRPASALPFDGDGLDAGVLENLFKTQFVRADYIQEINWTFEGFGAGARGIILAQRPGQVGHVFNMVVNSKGISKLWDGQSMSPFNPNSKPGSTRYWWIRTDK